MIKKVMLLVMCITTMLMLAGCGENRRAERRKTGEQLNDNLILSP